MLIYPYAFTLQKCSSEELTFKATMQDRPKVNIVGCSVTLPPADANLLAHLDLSCKGSAIDMMEQLFTAKNLK